MRIDNIGSLVRKISGMKFHFGLNWKPIEVTQNWRDLATFSLAGKNSEPDVKNTFD